jgi:hypothetical protein
MFRWIILSQAVIYLILMPALHARGELGYDPPLLVGLVGVVALLAGMYAGRLGKSRTSANIRSATPLLEPRPQLWVAFVGVAVVYDILSLNYGLLNRRQGSEFMADLYASLPISSLAVIRGFEILVLPIVILYSFSPAPFYQKVVVGLTVLISLPFMGLVDSRGRLLVMAITVLSFVPIRTFLQESVRNIRVYFVAALVLGGFLYFSADRAAKYYSASDYLQTEVIERLDGLNLVTQLREAQTLPYSGTFDPMLLSPLISRIPFLEAARSAKEIGRTSSKQYFLQDVLRNGRYDDSNSIITDPLYFAGIAGVILSFVALGSIIARFDLVVEGGRLLLGRLSTALMFAFAISFVMFENDFVGSLAAFLQSLGLMVPLLWVGCRYQSSEQWTAPPLRSAPPGQGLKPDFAATVAGEAK